MKVLGIYHRKDNDGYASAAVLKHWAFQNNHELLLVGYDYSDDPSVLYEAVKTFLPNEVFMVDVTFGGKKAQEAMIEFDACCKAYKAILTVIDHHEKAYNDFNVYCKSQDIRLAKIFKEGCYNIRETLSSNLVYVFNKDISACELAYCYLFNTLPQEVPRIIEVIGKYDTFRIPQDSEEWLTECYPFQLGSRLIDSEKIIEEVYQVLESVDYAYIRKLIEQGSLLMAYEAQQYKRSEQTGFRIVNGTPFQKPCLRVGIINAMLDPSMFKPSGDYDVVCVYHQVDNATWKYSLRPGSSSNQLDYTELASVFGGGGHAKACGFTASKNIFENSVTLEA
jgi:hypothetical protein